MSPFVLAELDYLIGQQVGTSAQQALLGDVGVGAYELATFSRQDVLRAAEVMAQYQDLAVGLADASIVVLAERLGTNAVLTLDQRHFRVLQGCSLDAFRLLPFDD